MGFALVLLYSRLGYVEIWKAGKVQTFARRQQVKLLPKTNLETKVVELPVGSVKGKHQVGITGHEFYSFEGIPFGKPPVGKLRFCPSQPAEPWLGKVLDCLKERSLPVQQGTLNGIEALQ